MCKYNRQSTYHKSNTSCNRSNPSSSDPLIPSYILQMYPQRLSQWLTGNDMILATIPDNYVLPVYSRPILIIHPLQRNGMQMVRLMWCARYWLIKTKLTHDPIWLVPLNNVEEYKWNHSSPQVSVSNTECWKRGYKLICIWLPCELHKRDN